MGHISRA